MKFSVPITLFWLTLIHAPLHATLLRTIPHGIYQCALPGNAAGNAWIEQKEERFRIARASRYRTDLGQGKYIVKGEELTFTSGPKNGQKLRRTGLNELRTINEDGSTGRMICVRIG